MPIRRVSSCWGDKRKCEPDAKPGYFKNRKTYCGGRAVVSLNAITLVSTKILEQYLQQG